jgi:hypothetical protein
MENSAKEASMKSLFKMLGLAAFLGLGAGAAQAGGGYPGDEHDFYYRQPDFNHNCFDMPWHPACHPRPRHDGHVVFVRPGVQIELQFGDRHMRHYDDYQPRPIIRQVRYCSNSMAVRTAQAMGIHNVRAYAYNDHVLIKGTKHGHRVAVTLSREWGCPAIDY